MTFTVYKNNIARKILDHFDDLEENTPYLVTVENWYQIRSKGQNDLFHAICREIAKEGGDLELIKQGLKDQYVDGDSTRRLSSKDMSRLIDGAILEASEGGIDVSRHLCEHKLINELIKESSK